MNWVKKITALIFFFGIADKTNSQLLVKYRYPKAQMDSGTYFDIVEPYNKSILKNDFLFPIDTIFSTFHDGWYQTTCKFQVKDTCVAFIADGFGHPTIIIPNDTVVANVKKIEKKNNQFILNDRYPVTWFYNFTYLNRNRYIYALFDSLAFNTGSVFMPSINLSKSDYSLQTFFDTLTNIYRDRIKYINVYSIRHNIPNNVKKLVYSEVYLSYISNLLQPLSNIVKEYSFSDYPKEYTDTLSQVNFGDRNLFVNTIQYKTVCLLYYNLFKAKFLHPTLNKVELLNKVFDEIIKDIDDKSQQQYLLASNFQDHISSYNLSFNNLLNRYKSIFPKSIYTPFLNSLAKEQKEISNISFSQAINSFVSAPDESETSISKLLYSKPLLIDCWATWCIPCVSQLPYTKQLQSDYKNKIDIVYLSFDKDKNIWLKKQNFLPLQSLSFILKDNFKSTFSKYFRITSIPRYIIINRQGNVVAFDAPRPSNLEKLRKILDKVVN